MNKRGFSLIELLVAVVVISILSVLVLAKHNPLKQKLYTSTLNHSINKLLAAEEVYFTQNGTYTATTCTATNSNPNPDCTVLTSATGFKPDQGVSLVVNANMDIKYGFRVTAAHLKNQAFCRLDFGRQSVTGSFHSEKIECFPEPLMEPLPPPMVLPQGTEEGGGMSSF